MNPESLTVSINLVLVANGHSPSVPIFFYRAFSTSFSHPLSDPSSIRHTDSRRVYILNPFLVSIIA